MVGEDCIRTFRWEEKKRRDNTLSKSSKGERYSLGASSRIVTYKACSICSKSVQSSRGSALELGTLLPLSEVTLRGVPKRGVCPENKGMNWQLLRKRRN